MNSEAKQYDEQIKSKKSSFLPALDEFKKYYVYYILVSLVSLTRLLCRRWDTYHDSDISRTFDNPKNELANSALMKTSPLIL